jgi:hypothetical protein
MAIITFSKPVGFPTAPLRDLLQKHLPLFKWQCGEHDMGGEKEMGRFDDHMLIVGRSSSTAIFTELRRVESPFPGAAYPHAWHLQIGAPTTELQPVADRVTLIIGMTVMILDEQDALCQLRPGGNWLTAQDLLRVFKVVLGGESIALADGLGIPPDRLAASDRPSTPERMPPERMPDAPTLGRDPPRDVARRMLAPMALMIERNLRPDWATIERFARELDPDGRWSHQALGDMDVLAGRGVRVMAHTKGDPVPAYVYQDAFTRSFWFTGDRSAIAAHRRHMTVACALDTAGADWVSIRQTAKIVTLVTGMLARLPGVIAVYNMDTGTIFEPARVGEFLGILGRNQLPVLLWTWTQWHSLVDGDVSMSTSGLMPFLGHELELWNAPLSAEEVRDQVSDLIIYLLDAGPTIGHGDTAGRTRGDQSIRCFLGPGRAGRDTPVQALFLEFAGVGGATLRADVPEVGAPAPDLPRPAMVSDEAAGRLASRMIDDALQSVIASSSSPAMRKLLSDVAASRGGQPAPTVPPPPAAPHAPPVRRVGGFGRKGL